MLKGGRSSLARFRTFFLFESRSRKISDPLILKLAGAWPAKAHMHILNTHILKPFLTKEIKVARRFLYFSVKRSQQLSISKTLLI